MPVTPPPAHQTRGRRLSQTTLAPLLRGRGPGSWHALRGGATRGGALLLPLPRASGAGLDTPAIPNRGLYPRTRAALHCACSLNQRVTSPPHCTLAHSSAARPPSRVSACLPAACRTASPGRSFPSPCCRAHPRIIISVLASAPCQVEDIVDSGRTAVALVDHFKAAGARGFPSALLAACCCVSTARSNAVQGRLCSVCRRTDWLAEHAGRRDASGCCRPSVHCCRPPRFFPLLGTTAPAAHLLYPPPPAGAASVKMASLLSKPARRTCAYKPEYLCFEVVS